MARVSMEAKGRFGAIFAEAVAKKDISLRDLAAKVDMTYEQMRKIHSGMSSPSPLLLKELIRILDLDKDKAERAVTADKMEKRYGKNAYNVLGRDPRIADIEDLLPQLSKQEWDMFVSQIRGFVHQKRRGQ